MSQQNDEAAKRKVSEIIADIDYAVFTTRGSDGAPLHARPMAYRSVEPDGDLWFFTKADSRKVEELKADPRTLLSFADPKKQHFVSITGRSEIVSDRTKVTELWSEIYRAWFPGGPSDPNVVAIRVHAEAAEYWDTPTSAVVYAFGYLKALTTGQPSRAGDVGNVDSALTDSSADRVTVASALHRSYADGASRPDDRRAQAGRKVRAPRRYGAG